MADRNAPADAAYQGAPGAFSEDAAWALAGPSATLLPCRTFADVLEALRSGRARAGVLPIHNSVAGDVAAAQALIRQPGLDVVTTYAMPVEQCLVAAPGASLVTLRRVVSHPMALAQCQRFLASHPHLTVAAGFDTAGSVATMVRRRRRRTAAIASARAASLWGGVVLARGIQDDRDNQTTFALVRICRVLESRGSNDHTRRPEIRRRSDSVAAQR